jgi:hypothetical protein
MLTDLGSILALKRVQDGSQIGSKTVSKRCKKNNQKTIGFLIDFWSSQEALPLIDPPAGAAVPGGGPPQKLLAKS